MNPTVDCMGILTTDLLFQGSSNHNNLIGMHPMTKTKQKNTLQKLCRTNDPVLSTNNLQGEKRRLS